MTTLILPTNITPFSTAPDLGDLATFRPRALAWAQSAPAFTTTSNALAANVYNNAIYTYEQAQSAAQSKNDALASANAALASANAAQTSALTAVNSAATNATSTTTMSLSNGVKTFTIQAGKEFSVGQSVVIASTQTPTNQMFGVIASHNKSTGAMTVSVIATEGIAGDYSDWTISVNAPAMVSQSIVDSSIVGTTQVLSVDLQLLFLALNKKV